jgi:copper transport protein
VSIWRLLLAAGLAATLSLIGPRLAQAHAEILRVDPPDRCAPLAMPRLPAGDIHCEHGALLDAPPAQVRVWFSEPVTPVVGAITVLAPSGWRVEQGPPAVDGSELSVPVEASEPGTYLVTWRVIAQDTHPARGRFAFSVDRESEPASSPRLADLGTSSPIGLGLEVVARWLHLAGLALSFGIVAFRLIVLDRLSLSRSEPVAGRLWGLVGVGTVLLLLAEPLSLLAQTASLASGAPVDADLVISALDSSFGRVWAQRLAAALLLWALVGAVRPALPRASWALLFVGGVLVLVDGQASHAANVQPLILGLLVNGVHLAAAAVWSGSLVGLVAIWHLPELAAHRGLVLSTGGWLALASISILALSGSVLVAEHLSGPPDLTGSTYGQVLLTKVSLLMLALLLGLVALRSTCSAPQRWWRREICALAAVLALAGLLVSLPPPR